MAISVNYSLIKPTITELLIGGTATSHRRRSDVAATSHLRRIDVAQELIEAYSSNTEEKREAANKQKSAGPIQALEDIVPDNVFKSFTSSTCKKLLCH